MSGSTVFDCIYVVPDRDVQQPYFSGWQMYDIHQEVALHADYLDKAFSEVLSLISSILLEKETVFAGGLALHILFR